MFEFAKNNTNDHCKRMSHYYSTIDDYINITDDGMLHETSMTDSIALIQSDSSHIPDSYYNIGSCTDTEPQVVRSGSDEPIFIDPGVEEDNIYSWLKSRKISPFRPHDIK